MDARVSLQFLGGVADGQNLTGSCYLLKVEDGKNTDLILHDCGSYQGGPYLEMLAANQQIVDLIDPKKIGTVVVSHGHIDHCARTPYLVRYGFGGRIYCTKPTAEILPIMLLDNVKIQKDEDKYRGRKEKPEKANDSSQRYLGNFDRLKNKAKKQKQSVRSGIMYDAIHVEQTCALIANNGYDYADEYLKGCADEPEGEWNGWIKIGYNIGLKFYESGHVFGGAICVYKIARRIAGKKDFLHIGFSGDLGRKDGIILPPPKIPKDPIDYWITESTYGGKKHPPRKDDITRLLDVVKDAVERKRKIIIPSFALERTQEVVYLLSKHIAAGDIPKIPIYLDAPMATELTKIFAANWYSQGLFKGQEELHFNPFDPEENKHLYLVSGQDASAKLVETPGPYIVIAGSGMCDAGRVRNHLRAGLTDPNTVVCLIGYMTKKSLGRKLKEHFPIVKMNDVEYVVRAEIVVFESFSAHADSPYLNEFAREIQVRNNHGFKKIIEVHGELKNALNLKVELMQSQQMSKNDILIPGFGETIYL
jgi:metallo-beta-lactamase family protein